MELRESGNLPLANAILALKKAQKMSHLKRSSAVLLSATVAAATVPTALLRYIHTCRNLEHCGGCASQDCIGAWKCGPRGRQRECQDCDDNVPVVPSKQALDAVCVPQVVGSAQRTRTAISIIPTQEKAVR